jgi:hypothetical protein
MVIDAEFDRKDHGLISCNCDREELESLDAKLTPEPD